MQDLELGESDQEEQTDFPPPERKVVTQPYDLSVQTLLEQWNGNSLLLPEIQREYVWDDAQASRLIESLMLNIPIPVVYFAETYDAKWEIIDGHQRVRSIARFLSNEYALTSLPVLSHFNRMRFHQLPEREKRFLQRRTLRAVVLTTESHPNMKFEVFERLNTSAVVLNAQEIRNSLYRGHVNRLLRELATTRVFREVIGTKMPRRRMIDEELILRFFALHENLKAYRPPLKRFLNTYMQSAKDADDEYVSFLRQLFNTTISRVAIMEAVGRNMMIFLDMIYCPVQEKIVVQRENEAVILHVVAHGLQSAIGHVGSRYMDFIDSMNQGLADSRVDLLEPTNIMPVAPSRTHYIQSQRQVV